MTAPARDALGRPLNPDTNLPYPSASQAQLELADGLLARLVDRLAPEVLDPDELRVAVRDALVEVAVRQHGRTLRACLDDLRALARANDEEAAKALDGAVYDGGRVNSGRVAAADTLARASLTLRAVLLRADRA